MARGQRERRAGPRVKAEMAAQVVCPPESDVIAVQTRDISCHGLHCRVPRYIEPSTRLHAAMILPLREGGEMRNVLVEFESLVVRIEPEHEEPGRTEYSVGLYFSHMGDDARALIGRYVSQRSEDTQ